MRKAVFILTTVTLFTFLGCDWDFDPIPTGIKAKEQAAKKGMIGLAIIIAGATIIHYWPTSPKKKIKKH